MNINELVRKAKRSAPDLEGVTDDAARGLLREAFKLVREEIDRTREGVVQVAVLGQFQIRPGEREKDGQTVPIKRIAFRPVKPKSGPLGNSKSPQPFTSSAKVRERGR